MLAARMVTDQEKDDIANGFGGVHAVRNRAVWEIGLWLGLRISELLSLRVSDVKDSEGRVKSKIIVASAATKTGRTYTRLVSDKCKELLFAWLTYQWDRGWRHDDYFLFPRNFHEPITRNAYGKALRKVVRQLKLEGCVSAHSMRKTCATKLLHQYQRMANNGRNLSPSLEVCRAMDWESESMLFKYIGKNDDALFEALNNM